MKSNIRQFIEKYCVAVSGVKGEYTTGSPVHEQLEQKLLEAITKDNELPHQRESDITTPLGGIELTEEKIKVVNAYIKSQSNQSDGEWTDEIVAQLISDWSDNKISYEIAMGIVNIMHLDGTLKPKLRLSSNEEMINILITHYDYAGIPDDEKYLGEIINKKGFVETGATPGDCLYELGRSLQVLEKYEGNNPAKLVSLKTVQNKISEARTNMDFIIDIANQYGVEDDPHVIIKDMSILAYKTNQLFASDTTNTK